MNNTEKKLREYMQLPYSVVLKRDEEGDIIARVKELEGCVADGQDAMEALGHLETMKQLWLTAALKAGREIPLPEDEDDVLPSGKWLTRVPRTLHKKLVALANREGVSLNQLVAVILAEAVGEKHREAKRTGSLAGLSAAAAATPAYAAPASNVVRFPASDPGQSWEEDEDLLHALGPKTSFSFVAVPDDQLTPRTGEEVAKFA